MADEQFDAFSFPWRGPTRSALIRRYLECEATGIEDDTGAVMAITGMTFMAPADEQWEVILELVREAPEGAIEAIAAGPIEGFLGRFGESVIDRVEQQAACDAKFQRILKGVWQHRMSDEVWARVQLLHATGD
jgi:hypothetical protein